jgi:hypothetical protein
VGHTLSLLQKQPAASLGDGALRKRLLKSLHRRDGVLERLCPVPVLRGLGLEERLPRWEELQTNYTRRC